MAGPAPANGNRNAPFLLQRQGRAGVLFVLAITLIALPGCELLQRQGKAKSDDDGRQMMMLSDTAPLASDTTPRVGDAAMQVPVEPSPFETGKAKKPHAMLRDLDPAPARGQKGEEPRPIPEEPIP